MKTLIAASIAAMSFAVSAQATTLDVFTGFVGFGDSLSDKGRQPDRGEPYLGGRFSSGPTWMEIIGAEFDMRGLGNFNLALGGATAGDTNENDPGYLLADSLIPRDPGNPDDIPFFDLGTFDRQITSFVDAGFDMMVGDNPLVGLLFGGNDFLQNLGTNPLFNPADVASDIAAGVRRLADLDPKFDDFLVLNLPDVSQTPANAGLSATDKALARGAVELFNGALEFELGLLAFEKGLDIEVFDLFSANDALLVEFEAAGIDITTPCVSGGVSICANKVEAEDFFFVDSVHPGGLVQARIADAVLPYVDARLSQVPLPAGFPLLLAGVGAFGALRIARRTAA